MLHASDLAVLGGKQPVLSRASSGCMCYTAGAIQRPQFMLYIMTPAFTRWVFALYLFCHDLRDSCEPAGADLLLPEHVGHNRSPQGIEEPSRPCALQQPCGSVANGLVYAFKRWQCMVQKDFHVIGDVPIIWEHGAPACARLCQHAARLHGCQKMRPGSRMSAMLWM